MPEETGHPVSLHYIYHESFDNPEMHDIIMAEMPDYNDYQEKINRAKIPKGISTELRQAYKSPLLTREQEAHLFRKMNYLKHKANKALESSNNTVYESSAAAAIEIQQLLILANYRLVLHLVKKMKILPQDFFDAVSEAIMPLTSSVLNFDFSRGFRFSTYACYSIMKWGSTYRYKMSKRERLRTNIADEFFSNQRSSDCFDEIEQQDEENNSKKVLRRCMGILAKRDKLIVSLYHGLGPKSPVGNDKWTLIEIAQKLGLTKQRVQQLQARALETMRLYNYAPKGSSNATSHRKNKCRSSCFLRQSRERIANIV